MRCGADFQCQKWSFIEGTKRCTQISMKFVQTFDQIGCISGNKYCDQSSQISVGKCKQG